MCRQTFATAAGVLLFAAAALLAPTGGAAWLMGEAAIRACTA